MAQQRMNVQAPIKRLFAERWSTRAFDADKLVTRNQLATCLEAARWAPSCFGAEPWRFVVVNRFEHAEDWQQVLTCLAPKNRLWAQYAPVFIVAVSEPLFAHNNTSNRWAEYDTGQAMVSLCLQATALGLASHQMGGFDEQALKNALAIPESLHVMSVTALGYPGEANALDAEFCDMETAPRTRKPQADTVHAGHWGTPMQPPAPAGWEARYQETPAGQLPWFYADLDPDIAQVIGDLDTSDNDVLDLGCGPGTQAVALAKQGLRVAASDVSGTAIEAAKALACTEGVNIEFHVDDILNSQLHGSFDIIVDRGIFHIFAEAADQQAYLSTVHRLLKPQGLLILKCFHKDETGEMGPPGRYDTTDIQRFFTDRFELLEARASHFTSSALKTAPKALFCVLKRHP